MSDYTPDQIHRADQTLAGINHQLDNLVTMVETDNPNDIADIDFIAEILRDTLTIDELAVTLSVAVHKLAAQ